MNSFLSDSILHSPNHRISESGQFYINGTMLGVLCLMAICAVALCIYYITWTLRSTRELEGMENHTIASASSSATIVHLPVFAPHTFHLSSHAGNQICSHDQGKTRANHYSRQSSPPPSYDSIFPREDTVRHTPL